MNEEECRPGGGSPRLLFAALVHKASHLIIPEFTVLINGLKSVN